MRTETVVRVRLGLATAGVLGATALVEVRVPALAERCLRMIDGRSRCSRRTLSPAP